MDFQNAFKPVLTQFFPLGPVPLGVQPQRPSETYSWFLKFQAWDHPVSSTSPSNHHILNVSQVYVLLCPAPIRI